MELLACIGLTFILKYGTILNIPRNIFTRLHPCIDKLFKCSLCLGFWSGCFIWYYSRENILLPLASAGLCWIVDNFNNVLQSIEIKLDKDNEG